MHTPITSPLTYFLVYLALLVLLAATIAAAFVDLGVFNPILTVTIAIVKALLVALIFMGVRHSTRLTRLFVFFGLIWFGILLIPTIADYISKVIFSQ